MARMSLHISVCSDEHRNTSASFKPSPLFISGNFFKDLFVLIFIYVCMHVWVGICAPECRCLQNPEENVRVPAVVSFLTWVLETPARPSVRAISIQLPSLPSSLFLDHFHGDCTLSVELTWVCFIVFPSMAT